MTTVPKGRDKVELLATVLLAVATVATELRTKLTAPTLRVVMLSIVCTVFLVTAIWMATSPISLSV